MKKYTLLVFLLSCFSCLSQNVISYNGEEINAIDENGLQVGIWKIYNEDKDTVIITEFEEGKVISGPMYYKNDVLIAEVKNDTIIKLYRGKEVIEAYWYTPPEKFRTLVDKDGNELDKDLLDYFFSNTDVYPKYYGGQTEMYRQLAKTINRKSIKKQKGRVVVGFVIDHVGNVTESKIIESDNVALNEEALRVIEALPRWQPGYLKGKLARIAYTVPLTFN